MRNDKGIDARSRTEQRKRKKSGNKAKIAVLAGLIAVIAIATVAVLGNRPPEITKITVGSAGDVMLHGPFYNVSEYSMGDGDYDFSNCFSAISDTYSAPNYMVVNLETTLSGKAGGYSGYPLFKSPDSIADSLSNAGADMLLLANNHIYDGGKDGFLRTSRRLEKKEIDYTGARHSDKEKRYFIKKIKGISVGIINYTYETPRSNGHKTINGNLLDDEAAKYLNSFDGNNLNSFYKEVKKSINAMEEKGAEFIIAYLHWGEEYQLQESEQQREIAGRLCNMGVDALIGSHPHVVQPVDVFEKGTENNGDEASKETGEEDENSNDNLMFCAFSLGNQLSNQREEWMNQGGYTEDGLIVNLEITKVDEEVSLTGVKYIPTWVYQSPYSSEYIIVPVNKPGSVETDTGISGISGDAKASKERTMSIINEGREKVKKAYGF